MLFMEMGTDFKANANFLVIQSGVQVARSQVKVNPARGTACVITAVRWAILPVIAELRSQMQRNRCVKKTGRRRRFLSVLPAGSLAIMHETVVQRQATNDRADKRILETIFIVNSRLGNKVI